MKYGQKAAQTEVVAAAKSLRPTAREYCLLTIVLPSPPLLWLHSEQLTPLNCRLGCAFCFWPNGLGMDVIKSHLSRSFAHSCMSLAWSLVFLPSVIRKWQRWGRQLSTDSRGAHHDLIRSLKQGCPTNPQGHEQEEGFNFKPLRFGEVEISKVLLQQKGD